MLGSLGGVLVRAPGLVLTSLSYARKRGGVEHALVDLAPGESAPAPERVVPGDGDSLLRRRDGRGRLYHRSYDVVVAGARTGPEELIDRLLVDPNRASPTELARFEPTSPHRGDGAEFAIRMPGPWSVSVRVFDRTPTSFRLATLRGHMEAGEIQFRARWGDGGRLLFTVESWTRSGDRLYDWLYHRLPLAREMQLYMWVHVCQRVAALTGGSQEGPVRVRTERSEVVDG